MDFTPRWMNRKQDASSDSVNIFAVKQTLEKK